MPEFDLVVRGGLWFDGTGAPGARRDLGIRDGRVAAVSATPLPTGPDTEVIDAAGKWVMPGFVDVHTHYDAEVLVNPGLPESVRHGVTTVVLGNCSLSTVYSDPSQCADLFSRVEAVPHDSVLAILDEHKSWQRPSDYVDALESLPLGPNVTGFIGHSDMRSDVLGIGRATDRRTKPTAAELDRLGQMLTEALDAGFLGMSSMTNALDKIDGDEYRSRSLPSTYARWREFRFLNRILRERGKILQSAPTINLHPNVAGFFAESSGLGRRRPLKTSLLSAADSKAYPVIVYFMLAAAPLLNRFAKTDFRWQHLPVPFTVYADGIDLVVFEEFGAGAAALHLRDEVERNELLKDEKYRRWFRKDYDNKFSPRIWHRDFYDAVIVACPDETVIGKTFGEVGDLRGVHPVDAYLDLVVEYGRKLRWRTTIANHRPKFARKLAASPGVQMGFGDAGAHLRNMAFYNFPIRLLKRVNDDQIRRKPFLTIERAIHRLTGELADWYDIDAGHLRLGDRADLVVVDPAGLDDTVDGLFEEAVPVYGGLRRMVNRNDRAAVATVIGGRIAFRDGEFTDVSGRVKTGRFLRAGRYDAREQAPTPAASGL
ncbi:amidohydrolase family protein [Rhodococcus sp. D2-41]|uniref:Amidohydrolase family protein n=1 Tax=Speluncibacter jeojiensis TaxID=2710754 RepID=A0A9X4M389_9ACTN|nr:amidohydrolase family protein [Rhodococcus sp. D2-41]MDG3012556.1 amidohydrolase family protein [Rhodococcus sp. D2-41]MDG3015327.1 amidohydrolase family protein [Corynebacteriales bacterium D3-21]